MSTILDALRKVAEEQHTHGTDVRTRLLSFPSRVGGRTRQRPGMVWIVSAGVAITGFAAGAGLMYWQSHSSVQEEPATTLARSTPDAPAPAGRGTPATPAMRPSVTEEAQPQRKIPDLPQGTLESVTPVPIPPSAPVVPRSRLEGKDQSSSLPDSIAALRAKLESEAARVVKEKQQFTSSPVPTPFSEPPDPQPTPTPPDVVPPKSFLPPAILDVLKSVSPGQPLPEANDPALSIPPVSPPLPAQRPPVIGETVETQTDVSLSFLQWSPDAEKRMAFLRVRGGPLTMAQEGDNVGGYTVTEISSEAVTLRSGDKTWILQVR